MISIVKILTRGGEGVKNPENLADVICEWPRKQLLKRERVLASTKRAISLTSVPSSLASMRSAPESLDAVLLVELRMEE